MRTDDRIFTGPIPRPYETYLVPPIFAPYAADLAQRFGRENVDGKIQAHVVTATR